MPDTADPALLVLTAEIVAAHAGHNDVPAEALPELIGAVYRALATRDAPGPAAPAKPVPAVPVRRSVFPDHIICLEDGKKLTMLTRYLRVRFDLTPDAYRIKWGLPPDYPMAAPDYVQKRSDLARSNKFGQRSRKAQTDKPAANLATEES